jgi:8-oxo-dGTP diphosphatase
VNGTRQYPERPIVGVGAVIVDEGRVVLVKRKYEPLKGHWSLPGGMVEVGETLEAALTREMLEETGLNVVVGPVIEVFDRITLDAQQRAEYHYVLIDYVCWPSGGTLPGTLRAGSDVDDAIWVAPATLGGYSLTEKATSIIHRALTLAREAPRPVR